MPDQAAAAGSTGERHVEPAWVEHVIWWQVYPLGFVDAPKEQDGRLVHRLPALLPWLDHLLALGANGLLLNPVFASESHGYDTTDYFRIDPRLGDDADIDALIAGCRERGIRVLFDGVFNHVGRGHPAFAGLAAQGPDAPTASWFRLTWPDDWQPGQQPAYRDFEGHGALVALNHDSPAVVDLVVEVMTHWLDRGIDGWRLDVAYAVPVEFWRAVLSRVREHHPDAWFVGEVIHGDYAEIVTGSTMDSVTQYELWKSIWSSLDDGNFFELAWNLKRHDLLLDSFVPQTFVGNHDVTRLASKLTDKALIPHALVLLMTVAGTPSIYYGDEWGLRGVKEDRAGGDDAVRPSFPADPTGLDGSGQATFDLHRELIGLRRRYPWLHSARTTELELTNTAFSYRAAAADGSVSLVVALNIADAHVDLAAPDAREIVAGVGALRDGRITVPAQGWAVLD